MNAPVYIYLICTTVRPIRCTGRYKACYGSFCTIIEGNIGCAADSDMPANIKVYFANIKVHSFDLSSPQSGFLSKYIDFHNYESFPSFSLYMYVWTKRKTCKVEPIVSL